MTEPPKPESGPDRPVLSPDYIRGYHAGWHAGHLSACPLLGNRPWKDPQDPPDPEAELASFDEEIRECVG